MIALHRCSSESTSGSRPTYSVDASSRPKSRQIAWDASYFIAASMYVAAMLKSAEESGFTTSHRPRGRLGMDRSFGSSGAQSADDRLGVALDDGEVGADGDFGAAAALLPILEGADAEAEEGREIGLR